MTGDPAINPWEAREAKARRRNIWLYGVLGLIGGVVGFTVAALEPGEASILTGGSIPPLVAIALIAITLLTVGVGSWKMWGAADEHERGLHLWSNSAAATVAILGYLIWFILWKGGLTQQPSAHILFLATVATGSITYFVFKLRG